MKADAAATPAISITQCIGWMTGVRVIAVEKGLRNGRRMDGRYSIVWIVKSPI